MKNVVFVRMTGGYIPTTDLSPKHRSRLWTSGR